MMIYNVSNIRFVVSSAKSQVPGESLKSAGQKMMAVGVEQSPVFQLISKCFSATKIGPPEPIKNVENCEKRLVKENCC